MRVYNFGAGPCALPVDVLEEVRSELLDYQGTGMSLIEMSHRSATYDRVHRRAMDLAREMAACPDDFEVLFVQGGATLQFSMVPLNLLEDGQRAGYVLSGSWARKAYADASKIGDAYPAWDGGSDAYRRMPSPGEVVIADRTRYLHVTTNETIDGIRMPEFPDVPVPLVADMSSELLARRIDWSRFGIVYGGIQKNLGPAGLAVVYLRRDLPLASGLPSYLSYRWHVESASLGNTPAMFQIYVMGKVLERLVARGGVDALERETREKAELVYRVIDDSDGFYRNPVEPAHRSHTNVVFRLPDEQLEAEFLAAAQNEGLVGLKGHRSVGGLRASLYSGVTRQAVEALADFMRSFHASH
ncbi:MAG: phosphoserine aminotransferase [Acidimicrobiia bacterium]|jgi:phosphoserine aminotransferase|nr:MAG: phosphoserine aminotransferase [Acidimicrobiia bacterium]